MKYSLKIGIKKSVKNIVVVGVLPALAYLSANYTDWLSPELAIKLAPVFMFFSYLLKNYVENK